MQSLQWEVSAQTPSLGIHEVHLWQVCLDQPIAVADYWPLLAPEEQARSQRFTHAHHQTRFVVARGILRQLLSQYLEVPPQDLKLTYTRTGKPELAQSCNPLDLAFNLSHSQDVALYGVTRGQAIGVDVEAIKLTQRWREIAQRYFAASEYQALLNLDPDEQVPAFYQIWARREACLKAAGGQLFTDLKSLQISQPLKQLSSGLLGRWSRVGDSLWWLMDIGSRSGYVAAIAIAHSPQTLRTFTWETL